MKNQPIFSGYNYLSSVLLVLLMTVSNAGADSMESWQERQLLIIDCWNYEEAVLGQLADSKLTPEKIDKLERIFNVQLSVLAQGGPNYRITKDDVLTKIRSFLRKIDDSGNTIAYIYLHAHGGIYRSDGYEEACLYSETARLNEKGRLSSDETILESEVSELLLQAKNQNSRLDIFLFIDACSQSNSADVRTMSDRQFRWHEIASQKAKERKSTYLDVADLVMFAGRGSVPESDNIYSQLADRYRSGHLKSRLTLGEFKNSSRSEFVFFPLQNRDKIIRETRSAVFFEGFTASAQIQESTVPVFLHQPNHLTAGVYSFKIRERRDTYFEDYYLLRRLEPGTSYYFTPDSFSSIPGRILVKIGSSGKSANGSELEMSIGGDAYIAKYSDDEQGFVCNLLPGIYDAVYIDDRLAIPQVIVSSNTNTTINTSAHIKESDIPSVFKTDVPFLTNELDVESGSAKSLGITAGINVGYPVWKSSGLFNNDVGLQFGVIVGTPYGLEIGPFAFGLGAEVGYFSFPHTVAAIEAKGIVALGTVNTMLYDTPSGPISLQLGGGFYGASIGATAGISYDKTIGDSGVLVRLYGRANATLDSGSSVGSVSWISIGTMISYDMSAMF